VSPRTIDEQLDKYLADAHSIEEQALTQLRRAPDIAGDERLAAAFQRHLAETNAHEDRIRRPLEARAADASAIKDIAGKAGGLGMVAFAKANPDTPGRLTAHAFSYEHMEIAASESRGGRPRAASPRRQSAGRP
jgi:ferritin-like metal-binding protein YciE